MNTRALPGKISEAANSACSKATFRYPPMAVRLVGGKTASQ